MLKKGRVDVLVEADPVFWYTAKMIDESETFTVAGRASESMKSYIAFSPALDTSKEYARQLSEGIQMLRENGELEAILEKYGLTDWKTAIAKSGD